EIIESAYVDGASEMSIFRKIIMPLSLPILATIGLLVGLAYWNDWENGLYYITKYDMYSYQLILNQMLTSVQYLAQLESAGLSANTMPSSDGMRMAIATLGLLPILMVYPFFQRYFVKGINIGAVKG
ncbi:MAG TPA: carbohydrate ABC transporter permease, partial [Candidatus Avichristensenella intestinipullorum]|nr:carbohydrate ABC transporter permease [Candidatus Avichristensenella intestinipullorum]